MSKVLILGESGSGKALSNAENVLTPNGWVKNGTLKIGDKVIGSSGKAITITEVHPQGVTELYNIKYQDGSSYDCDINHIIPVVRNGSKTLYKKTIRELLNLKLSSNYTDVRYNTIQKKLYYYTMLPKAIEYNKCDTLPLDPYTLGVILGDGGLTTGNVRLTISNDDIINKLQLPENTKLSKILQFDKCKSFSIIKVKGLRNPLISILTELNIMGKLSIHKFIPKIYLYSSIENRKALLQGLIDTDGHIYKNRNGYIEYSTSSELLKNDIIELISSLGIYNTVTERIPKYTYNNEIKYGHLTYRIYINLNKTSKYIDSITKLTNKNEATCITVDALDSLYVTNGFNLTHNSTSIGKSEELGIIGLNPAETFIIACTNKDLPFKGWKKQYVKAKVAFDPSKTTIIDLAPEGNYYYTNVGGNVANLIDLVSSKRPEIKNIVIDDSNYLLQDYYMANAMKGGFDVFKKIGLFMAKVFTAIGASEKNIFMFGHYEEFKSKNNDQISYRYKTVGSMTNQYITPAGKFSIVLFADQTFKEETKQIEKVFITNFDGNYPAKSPPGMFDLHTPNDLGKILEKIHAYDMGE